MREELIKNRNADPFKLLGVSNEDKLTFFLLKWKFNQSEAETMPKVDLVREFRINDAIRVASGIENVKSFEEKLNQKNTQKQGHVSWAELLDFFFLKDSGIRGNGWWNKLDGDGKIKQPKQDKSYSAFEVRKRDEHDSEEDSDVDPLERRR